jgi:hypothetical protein
MGSYREKIRHMTTGSGFAFRLVVAEGSGHLAWDISSTVTIIVVQVTPKGAYISI